MMVTNFCNGLIFYASVAIIIFCFYKLFETKKNEKIKRYFIWFLITGCTEILQMILLDIGVTTQYPVLLLFYWPFQFLSPFYFSLFTFQYLQRTENIIKYRNILLAPFVVFSAYYVFLKINFILGKPLISQQTVNFISSEIEENFTVLYLFGIGVFLYNKVSSYEYGIKHLAYEYVHRQTKWLRSIYLAIISLCVFWAIIIINIYISGIPKTASNYYGLWIVFLLFYVVSLYVSFPHFKAINIIRNAGLKIVENAKVNSGIKTFNTNHSNIIEIPVKQENRISIPLYSIHNNEISKKEFVRKEEVVTENEIIKEESTSVISPLDTEFLEKVTKLVAMNLSKAELDINFILKEMHLSRTQLHRKLKMLTGCSASAFIRMMRLKKAMEIMDNGNFNLKQVAYEIGFSDASYFAKCFKNEFEISPSAYILRIREKSCDVRIFGT